MLVYSVMGGRHVRCFFRATTGSGDEVTMDGGLEAGDFPRPCVRPDPRSFFVSAGVRRATAWHVSML
jgi:hypothetical protein